MKLGNTRFQVCIITAMIRAANQWQHDCLGKVMNSNSILNQASIMVASIKFKPLSLLKLAALIIFVVSLTGCFEPPPYNNLDNQQLQSMLQKGTQIFDIRRREEWRETGVVAKSKLLTFVDASGRVIPGFMEKFTSSVGKNDPVILICRTGNRTDVLARHLVTKLGYTQVFNVRYGITDWIRKGLPVTRPRY